MDKVKIGIIGAGRIGRIHAENLLRHPQAAVAGISDPFGNDELREWAAERGIPVVAQDSGVLLADPDIQAIFICSPTDTHVPLIKQAAAAGKHIFCEKPVSMNLAETKEAIEAAESNGVILQIGFNRRFDHNFSRVRELVRNGDIGDPHLIKITSRDPAPPSADYIKVSGGLFMDMMIHDFDMARYLSGSEAVEVYATGAVLVDPVFAQFGDVDTAVVTITFASGALGVIDNSRKAVYGYDQRVEVFGSGGSAAVSNDYPNSAEVHTAEGVRRDKPLHFFLERYNGAYIDEAAQFIASIKDGTAVPVSGRDAYQAELMALAAKQSLQLGRPVKLTEAAQSAISQ